MAEFEAGDASVLVVSRHRLGATSLAVALQSALRTRVGWCDSRSPSFAPVVVVLALHEPAESVPRLLAAYSSTRSRVIFVYDGARAVEQLLSVAARFQVWSAYDAREDFLVLADQVSAARSGRAWAHDRTVEQWSRALGKGEQVLSPREREVAIAYCSAGDPSPEHIAEALGISVNTVRTHLANVRRKISHQYTGNRNALRGALLDRGWID